MIAGTVRLRRGPRCSRVYPLPNDGVVCLDETRMPGLRDHLDAAVESFGHARVCARDADQIGCYFSWSTGHFARAQLQSWLRAPSRGDGRSACVAVARPAARPSGYYFQALNGQMELTRKARPIPEVIADPGHRSRS